MFTKIKKEINKKRMKKGLYAWGNLIKDMEASGKYSEEQLNNAVRWFAEACVQYREVITK